MKLKWNYLAITLQLRPKLQKGFELKENFLISIKRGLKDGDQITFIYDSSIKAIVAGNRQVLFEGQLWYLSPLTREIYSRKGQVNASGAYQGPAYFEYQGIKLSDIASII